LKTGGNEHRFKALCFQIFESEVFPSVLPVLLDPGAQIWSIFFQHIQAACGIHSHHAAWLWHNQRQSLRGFFFSDRSLPTGPQAWLQ
jgi:hypothetical protein